MDQIRPEIRTLLLGAVTMSTAAWSIAFNLGAYHTVFFTDLFKAWAAVTAVLIAVLFLPRQDSPVPWWGIGLLIVPTLGISLVPIGHATALTWVDQGAMVTSAVAYLVSLPYALYVGIRIVNADFLTLPSRRLRIALLVTVLLVVVAAFAAGAHNDALLTCGDFIISGNDQPANCRPGPPLTF